jgi:hypothetical protein
MAERPKNVASAVSRDRWQLCRGPEPWSDASQASITTGRAWTVTTWPPPPLFSLLAIAARQRATARGRTSSWLHNDAPGRREATALCWDLTDLTAGSVHGPWRQRRQPSVARTGIETRHCYLDCLTRAYELGHRTVQTLRASRCHRQWRAWAGVWSVCQTANQARVAERKADLRQQVGTAWRPPHLLRRRLARKLTVPSVVDVAARKPAAGPRSDEGHPIIRMSRQDGTRRATDEDAMSDNPDNGIIYIALVLAAAAAIMSAPTHTDEALRRLQRLLLTDTQPETLATVRTISATPRLPDVTRSSFSNHLSRRHRSAERTDSRVWVP